MDPLAEFFVSNLTIVFFFYGLSFFTMGLAVLLEVAHASELDFSRALIPLAAFGLVHGSHEWFEMFLLINPAFAKNPANAWIPLARVMLLAISFVFLIAFGARLISSPTKPRLQWIMISTVVAIWGIGLLGLMLQSENGAAQMVAADVYTRYALAIPGAALAVWGLLVQRRKFIQEGMPEFGLDMLIAALAFGIYGGIGQLFVTSSMVFPSTYLNSEVFLKWFGFPIQVLRAAMATVTAFAIIHSLRVFEVVNRRRVEALREAQMAERRRLEAIRAELLHRTVKAQEAERQRIAHELHDETGQTLTALGMGLRGLSQTIGVNPDRAVQQADHLERLASHGLRELQRLVGGLHPPQLDDLGLIAALRWYTGEIHQRYGFDVKVSCNVDTCTLPIEQRIVLFRIAQEAITNIIRHANASQASIRLFNDGKKVEMYIEDDGQGFDVWSALHPGQGNPSWGLLGMEERASLIGGLCQINSQPGRGTQVLVTVPLEPNSND